MKIAYLGQMADVASENGISKKIRAQAHAWIAAGHSVRYFALTPTATAWPGLDALQPCLLARGGPLIRARRSRALTREIRAWQPDVIYFRYAHHSAGLPALFRDVPTVAEINSDDLAEYPLTLTAAKLIYHRLTRRRILDPVAGFAPVTHELRERFAGFGKPTMVIANGIELPDQPGEASPQTTGPRTAGPKDLLTNVACSQHVSGFKDFSVSPIAGSTPRLIFVGSSGTPWHGLERLAELARLMPEFQFDIVGCLAPAVPQPSNLQFHGTLSRAAYEPLLQQATAAIGTMALFRKHMEEACPLKVREYLAAGLPVIAGYRDTDIPDGADYFLRLPNNAAPLAPHRERIAAWLASWQGRRVPRDAIAHLDYGVKEKQRLEFLARFANIQLVTENTENQTGDHRDEF